MKDFDILFKEGRFVGGAVVTAKVWKIDEEKHPRREYVRSDLKIGFVVPKKVHKSAVRRNRIKRQIREVVRLMLKNDQIKEGFMCSIIAKPLILGKKYEEIAVDVRNVLKKARMLRS